MIVLYGFLSCASYQIGGTLEPRGDDNNFGVFLGGDVSDDSFSMDLVEFAIEQSIVYLFPALSNDEYYNKAPRFGYNLYSKYRIYLFNDNFCIFPIIGYEARYTHLENADSFKDKIDMGINFGAGIDILALYPFVFSGKVVYQPEFSSFMNSASGFRYSLTFGYRKQQLPRVIKEKVAKEKEAKEREEQEKQRLFANEMELANTSLNNDNYGVALTHFRNALKLYPDNTNAINGLSNAWNKRIEENSNLYPAPFNGKWQYKIPPSTRLEPVQVYNEGRALGLGRAYGYRTEMREVKVPGRDIDIIFDGKNYIIKDTNGEGRTGTFFYHENVDIVGGEKRGVADYTTIIELDNDVLLGFNGTRINLIGTDFFFERIN
jgi:hypothetical protein